MRDKAASPTAHLNCYTALDDCSSLSIKLLVLSLTGDARPRFFEFWTRRWALLEERAGGDAREAMTVGCKPTTIKLKLQSKFTDDHDDDGKNMLFGPRQRWARRFTSGGDGRPTFEPRAAEIYYSLCIHSIISKITAEIVNFARF